MYTLENLIIIGDEVSLLNGTLSPNLDMDNNLHNLFCFVSLAFLLSMLLPCRGLNFEYVTVDYPLSIGEFEALSIFYANKYSFINATIVDIDKDFVNATVEISNGVILKWDATTDSFSEYQDKNNYCTLDASNSFRTSVNSTAYKLSWRVKLNWTYPEGPVDVVATNTKVYDSVGASSSCSKSGLFIFEDDLIVDAQYVDTGYYSYSSKVVDAYDKINNSRIVSELPLPNGYEIVSAQAATYYDDADRVLHVWYGLKVSGQGEDENEVLYTNTTDFITWADPVVVIDLPSDGIRDPTIFVEGGYIYLFCQCYNATTGKYHPIRLYKISKSADFWDPAQYIYIGDIVDLGSSGEFDDTWVASFCLVKINDVYYGAYEAKDSNGTFSIGRTNTTNIESVPYNKDGQVWNSSGGVLYNPVGSDNAIVPDTFADYDALYIHYDNDSGVGEDWQARYLIGDFSENSMTISTGDFDPVDPYHYYNNIAHIGHLNGRYAFLVQSWNPGPTDMKLRLYMEPPRVNPSTSLSIKGILYYEGTETPPEDTSGITVRVELSGKEKGTTSSIDSAGGFTISGVSTETSVNSYSYIVSSVTDQTSEKNQTVNVIVDRYVVSSKGRTDDRTNINEDEIFWFILKSEYDGRTIGSGETVTLNASQPATWNATANLWEYKTSKSTPQKMSYYVASIQDVYGVTALKSQAENHTSIIWDRLQITSGGSTKRERVPIGEPSTIYFTVQYEFDSEVFDDTKGSLYINGSEATWNSNKKRWEAVFTYNNVGDGGVFIVSNILETRYGLTVINDEAGYISCIWKEASGGLGIKIMFYLAFLVPFIALVIAFIAKRQRH